MFAMSAGPSARRASLGLALAALVWFGASCAACDGLARSFSEMLDRQAARAALPRCAVGVAGARGHGQGAIVGPRTVLTAGHVVADTETPSIAGSFAHARARIVRRFSSWPESVVVLEVEREEGALGFEGFEASRIVRPARGRPAYVVTGDGAIDWGSPLVAGDSGSPVLDVRASLVGLIHGETAERLPVRVLLPDEVLASSGRDEP